MADKTKPEGQKGRRTTKWSLENAYEGKNGIISDSGEDEHTSEPPSKVVDITSIPSTASNATTSSPDWKAVLLELRADQQRLVARVDRMHDVTRITLRLSHRVRSTDAPLPRPPLLRGGRLPMMNRRHWRLSPLRTGARPPNRRTNDG